MLIKLGLLMPVGIFLSYIIKLVAKKEEGDEDEKQKSPCSRHLRFNFFYIFSFGMLCLWRDIKTERASDREGEKKKGINSIHHRLKRL